MKRASQGYWPVSVALFSERRTRMSRGGWLIVLVGKRPISAETKLLVEEVDANGFERTRNAF